jgi:hypothetical protein
VVGFGSVSIFYFLKIENKKQKISIFQGRAFWFRTINQNDVYIEKLKCKAYKSAKISASYNEKYLRL